MFRRRPRFIKVRLEVREGKDFQWNGWYPPAALPVIVSEVLRDRHDKVASAIVSTLSRADAEEIGFAYADQIPEGPEWNS